MVSELHEFHLSLLGKDISPVQSARDLGVILDPNLTFDNHIGTSVSEWIARLAQINRVKNCLDKNTLLTVTHALVFSKMYYVGMCGQIPQIRMLENCRPFKTLLAESSAVRKNMIM